MTTKDTRLPVTSRIAFIALAYVAVITVLMAFIDPTALTAGGPDLGHAAIKAAEWLGELPQEVWHGLIRLTTEL